jgi:ankyrin repeat protein
MAVRKVSISVILIFALFFLFSGRIIAQVDVIDTSSYMPLYYDYALEFNLMVAAAYGYDKEVERMILKGADVNAATSDAGITPLILAISNNRLETVKTLLRYNADPNKATIENETPLLVAVKSQNSQISKALQEVGINVEYQNLEISETLIRYGADINYQDKRGVTALNYASIYGYYYLVDILLYYGADIDKKANDGTTPLMAAIWAGHADIADLLIKNGANMESRDDEGFTPLLIAAQNGDTLLLNLLMKKGVDIYEKNIYNSDALSLSIKYGYNDSFKMLYKDVSKWNDHAREHINYYNYAVKNKRDEIVDLLGKNSYAGKYKFRIDQVTLSFSSKFTFKDHYTGLSFDFKEPLAGFGLRTGFDTKLFYTKVLVKKSSNVYYQFMDKSSLIYAGIFKDFRLTNNPLKSNFIISASLSTAYFFGNRFKGSETAPESKYKVIPEISIKWIWRNFSLFSGIEYMKTDFCRIGPIWGRAGLSYNFHFDFVKSYAKTIKWF